MVVVTTGPGSGHKIFLISGKHTAQPGATEGRFNRAVSVVLPPSGSQASSDSDSNGSGAPPRKRQRLTHLSPEEKSLRRSLKNRVAAQTARDRKKAKMGELEQQVLDLELENQKLHLENRLLREQTHNLMTENQEFRQRLVLDALEVKEKVQVVPSSVVAPSMTIGSSESAALRLRVPLQKVQAQQSSRLRKSTWTLALMSDLLLSLLDVLDPELLLKCDSQDPRGLLEQTGTCLQVPAPTSLPVGAPSAKLEAHNELINWDHIYTKPVEVEVASTEHSEESNLNVKRSDEKDEVAALVEMCSVKEESEEGLVPKVTVGDFLVPGSPKETSCLSEANCDSGYEQSPSPFSSMSSPLWDDIFATELFPQLIHV
ncbi:X-box binding protein 1B-like [Arapaima gigas]